MNARILAGAALVLASSLGGAQEFYVDAANGDDANGGTSWGDAWRTVGHASANVPYSATIHLAPGVYDPAHGESFPIHLASRTFVGAGPEATVLDGGGAGSIFEEGGWLGTFALEGLALRNAATGLNASTWGLLEHQSSIVLRDVWIRGMSSAGIRAISDTDYSDVWLDLEVERARIEECSVGIELRAFAIPNHPTTPPTAYARLVCSDSLVAGNGTGLSGTLAGWGPESCELELARCTIAGSSVTGVHVGQGASALVRSTILAGNAQDLDGDVELAWSCTTRGPAPGPGNVAGDPLFADPASGDWRPGFGSPCVDAAGPGPAPADLAGRPRTADGDLDLQPRADMGAFELAPLTARTEARIGAALELELWGPAGGVSTVLATRGPLGPRRWTPFGWSLLAPPTRLLGTLAVQPGPPAILTLHLPDDGNLVGQTISFQALTSSDDAPAGQAWTNALELTVLP